MEKDFDDFDRESDQMIKRALGVSESPAERGERLKRKHPDKNFCPDCGAEIGRAQRYCGSCACCH